MPEEYTQRSRIALSATEDDKAAQISVSDLSFISLKNMNQSFKEEKRHLGNVFSFQE